ncbi:two-component system response regulator [Salegentibacter salinarum]|uniref:Two-component system response regulator n=1 Tax=Salegentibacter salinarum TaxID=447422 RepID=A0A2N0TND7_9FLAO|nr:response regulator transcription factor [Salegentibacter salinarum]PKD16247.1 two-component system response regulator [Salegentibacter salinarum]SKB67497.1 DNA-binding response regulator, OmpR family, contains REC and winged-helix (wHTH) domain [Salegentibacter salinarum]
MPDKKHKILLVEDDDSLGYLLSEYLKIKEFEVFWAQTGKKALELIEADTHDLIILDVMLPDIDGFSLANKLKINYPETPFIFLTARSMKIDVLKGFSLGAVDYLKKPIDEEELVVRIHALLSRVHSFQKESEPEEYIFKIGEYDFNSKSQELIFNKEIIYLTARENELLNYLVQNKNKLCSHKDILVQLWGKNDYFNRKSLNVFISHLRKYLKKDSKIKIENLHKKGFILKTD